MTERFAVPVKYVVMPMQFLGRCGAYKIIDTSFEGQFQVVSRFLTKQWAHLICALLNHNEGYEYPYETRN